MDAAGSAQVIAVTTIEKRYINDNGDMVNR
jgi:hypothetical protein